MFSFRCVDFFVLSGLPSARGVGGVRLLAWSVVLFLSLDDERKRRLDGLRAVHSWEASRLNTGNRPATEEEKRDRPPVSHPIVRTHPESGRKSLYIGIHTSHVEGMSEAVTHAGQITSKFGVEIISININFSKSIFTTDPYK